MVVTLALILESGSVSEVQLAEEKAKELLHHPNVVCAHCQSLPGKINELGRKRIHRRAWVPLKVHHLLQNPRVEAIFRVMRPR